MGFVSLWENTVYQNNKNSWYEFSLDHCWWFVLIDWLRLHKGWKIKFWGECQILHEDTKFASQVHEALWYFFQLERAKEQVYKSNLKGHEDLELQI